MPKWSVENPLLYEPRKLRTSEAIVHEPTTFQHLGIESPYNPRLNLASSEIVTATVPSSDGGKTYLTTVRHPFLGVHLSDALNLIAPMKSRIAHSISTRINGGNEGLDVASRELVEHHEATWDNALGFTSLDNLFRVVHELDVFNPDPEAVNEQFQKFKQTAIQRRVLDNEFRFLSPKRRAELEEHFFQQMTPGEQVAFIMHNAGGFGKTLVDFSSRKISPRSGMGVEAKFVDGTFCLQQHIGYDEGDIGVTIKPDKAGALTIDSYEFPEMYRQKGLHPLIAWNRSADGQRHFLSQAEANQLLKTELGLRKQERQRMDVVLGRVFAAAFSPKDVTAWQKERPSLSPISEVAGANLVRASEVPLWVLHPNNAAMLLADTNSVLPTLEKAA